MSHALDPAPDIHRIGRTSYSGRKVYDTVPDPKSSPTVWEYVLKGQQQAQQGGAQPAEDEEARKQQQEGERAKAAGTPGDQGLDSRDGGGRMDARDLQERLGVDEAAGRRMMGEARGGVHNECANKVESSRFKEIFEKFGPMA